MIFRSVVVEQLVERSLPKPEIRGSNPSHGQFYEMGGQGIEVLSESL